jgi:hypothetical protein
MFHLFNFAYLDPSTGSLIIQSVIGAIAGISVFGRNAIRNASGKVKQLFSKNAGAQASAKSEPKTE